MPEREAVAVPEPRAMRKLRWSTNAQDLAYMRKRREENLHRALGNHNENWMAEKLATTGRKWRRQALWGHRIFDFWCHELGIAVEVDGPEHDPAYDAYRDEYNYRRSGVLVLRVRNRNEADAVVALERIAGAVTWKERREVLGLNRSGKKNRRHLVEIPA